MKTVCGMLQGIMDCIIQWSALHSDPILEPSTDEEQALVQELEKSTANLYQVLDYVVRRGGSSQRHLVPLLAQLSFNFHFC